MGSVNRDWVLPCREMFLNTTDILGTSDLNIASVRFRSVDFLLP